MASTYNRRGNKLETPRFHSFQRLPFAGVFFGLQSPCSVFGTQLARTCRPEGFASASNDCESGEESPVDQKTSKRPTEKARVARQHYI